MHSTPEHEEGRILRSDPPPSLPDSDVHPGGWREMQALPALAVLGDHTLHRVRGGQDQRSDVVTTQRWITSFGQRHAGLRPWAFTHVDGIA